MITYKKDILDIIGYTELVYVRINKKLGLDLSNKAIEKLIFSLISETDESGFLKKGKNIYISNFEKNIRLTINSYTLRIITADRLNNK